VVVLAVALLVQLTFVNRLPLPGGESGAGPNLVLLGLVALAMQTSPAVGAMTGFCAGLALDLAPPGSYLIGEYALVFCLVGYFCGRIREVTGGSALLTILAAMTASAIGEALSAALGRVVSDPQVTWMAVRHVLPASVIYDVVLTPFVLYAVLRTLSWVQGLAQVPEGGVLLASAHPAGPARPGATVLGGAGLLGGAGWLSGSARSGGRGGGRGTRRGAARPPRTPRLRSAAARPGDGWIGGGRRAGLGHPPRRRPVRQPRLRPAPGPAGRARRGAGGRAGHPGHPVRSPQFRPGRQPNLRPGSRRHRDGTIGGSLGSGGAARRRTASGPPGSAFRQHGPVAGRAHPRVPLPGRRAGAGGLRRERTFRPDPRLRGGSASGPGRPGRGLPARRVTLHLGASRRRDGVFGGGVLSRGRSALGLRALGSRPVSLRLGSRRHRDGVLGGVAPRRRFWARRQAVPRFRSGPSLGHRLTARAQAMLRRRRRVRFSSGRRSFLGLRTGGRLGSRSAVWRIGSKRTGGL
jgi:rod shape-determining protein MreD